MTTENIEEKITKVKELHSRYRVMEVVESIKASIPNYKIEPEDIRDNSVVFTIKGKEVTTEGEVVGELTIGVTVDIKEDGSESWYIADYKKQASISSIEEFLRYTKLKAEDDN